MRALNPGLPAKLILTAWMTLACAPDKRPVIDAHAHALEPVSNDGATMARGDPGAPAIVEVAVTDKGFVPARFNVRPLQPVVLRMIRTSAATCADAVDVQGDPVRHPLPLGKLVEVRFTAPASGDVEFACPMNLLRGAAVVVR